MSGLVCALTIFAIALFAQNPEPATPPSALPRMLDIPLVDCSGLPCIDMSTANGKTLRLLISTAEANSYLDTKAAQALGLDLKPLKGADGSTITDVQQTVVPGAKLGELPMADFPFMVLDTTQPPGNPGAQLEPLPGDGALTYTAFRNRLLQIDYPHQVVRISQPQETAQQCPQPCSDLVETRIGKHGPRTLTAKGFAVYGQPVDAQIDTLFTGTMLVYPGSVQKLGLKKEAKAKRKELFPYIENGIKLARYDGAAESFHDVSLVEDGPLYFFTPKDTPPVVDFDVTVGSGLFSRAVVTFDFKGMHIWVEKVEPPPSEQQ
jgi:Aspartyl protease